MRLMANFNVEKIEIAVRYRNELNNPLININNDIRICINCDELLKIDLANVDNLECFRLRVLKYKSSNICCICNNREDASNRISVKANSDIS